MSEKPRILVVDDDAPIVTLMRSLLREFGFEPLTAMSGEAAIDTARLQTPDLILLDKNMPGMSGDEVIRLMRGEPSLESVPILILSGEPIGPGELARLGADGAVQKPFDVTDLVEQIRSRVAAV
jgi:CheY-like chemotaxis protein